MLNTKIKIYDSLEDLPVWNWDKANETKDLKYLLVTDNYKTYTPKKKVYEKLNVVWNDMSYDYFDFAGFSLDFLSLMNKKVQFQKMEIEYHIRFHSGGNYKELQAPLEILAKEIQQKTNKLTTIKKQSLLSRVARLAKYYGVVIDIYTTPVSIYLSLEKEYREACKQQEKQIQKQKQHGKKTKR